MYLEVFGGVPARKKPCGWIILQENSWIHGSIYICHKLGCLVVGSAARLGDLRVWRWTLSRKASPFYVFCKWIFLCKLSFWRANIINLIPQQRCSEIWARYHPTKGGSLSVEIQVDQAALWTWVCSLGLLGRVWGNRCFQNIVKIGLKFRFDCGPNCRECQPCSLDLLDLK